MTLLNELITIHRLNDQPGQNDDVKINTKSSNPEECSDCGCDPCECDNDEQGIHDTDGMDDMSDDMSRLDDLKGDRHHLADKNIDPANSSIEDEEDDTARGSWASEMGKRAFHRGEKIDANPYDPDPAAEADIESESASRLSLRWKQGWKAAHEEWLSTEDEDEESTSNEDDPYLQGREAFRNGQGYQDNPHPEGSAEHLDWREGNLEAEEDEKQEHGDGMSDVEADAQTLANVGWGTDEDYGSYGGDENEEGDDQCRPRVIDVEDEGSEEDCEMTFSQYMRGSENEESADPFNLGFAAFDRGFDIGKDNPFKNEFNSKAFQLWRAGFRAAEDDQFGEEKTQQHQSLGREDEETAPEDTRAFSNIAFTKGEQAFQQGASEEDNLYPEGTLKHREWLEGFRHAENEAHEQGGRTGDHEHGDEDEGYGATGLGAYGQQGQHMGGMKQTDDNEIDRNPDAADELDLGDDLGDNEPNDAEKDETDPKLDALTDKATEDPDKQGLIRTAKGAHLVYKRQTEVGTYEELWIYNSGNLRDGLGIRKAILAGTDIPTNQTKSPDGKQQYELWSSGNAEMLQVKGLPN